MLTIVKSTSPIPFTDNSTCLNTCNFEMNAHTRKMKNLKFNFTFDAEYKLLNVCTKRKADSVENVLNIKCVSWMKGKNNFNLYILY